jgi:mono/diheme cytochrome c family protein
MRPCIRGALLACVASAWVSLQGQTPSTPSVAAPSTPARVAALSATPARAPQGTDQPDASLVAQYCVTCHNGRTKAGNLVLDSLPLERIAADAETWEKVIRKVRAGMMPPAGARRPERAALDRFAGSLERVIDQATASLGHPGRVPLHRMNRAEYGNAIRDLLALDVDASTLLPADDSSRGFDNIADVLSVSPSLLERYVAAAAKISRLAVGEREAAPTQVTYTVKGDLSQNQALDGQPLGTRGGTIVRHTFPVDGEYAIKLSLLKLSFGQVFGEGAEGEQLEVTLNGERVKLRQARTHPSRHRPIPSKSTRR